MTAEPTMTASQFQWHLKRLGLSVYAAAPFLGISLRHAYRMTNDEYPVPVAIGKLLRLMHRFDVKPEDLQ